MSVILRQLFFDRGDVGAGGVELLDHGVNVFLRSGALGSDFIGLEAFTDQGEHCNLYTTWFPAHHTQLRFTRFLANMEPYNRARHSLEAFAG